MINTKCKLTYVHNKLSKNTLVLVYGPSRTHKKTKMAPTETDHKIPDGKCIYVKETVQVSSN